MAGNPAAPRAGGYACVPDYIRSGVCLSYDPEYATVGQGNVGIGFDILPLTSGVGLFGELAVHGYDSPAHVYVENTASDKFAFTTRGVLGLKFSFGAEAPERSSFRRPCSAAAGRASAAAACDGDGVGLRGGAGWHAQHRERDVQPRHG